MDTRYFNFEIIPDAMDRSMKILGTKEKEYAAAGDRLDNFKVAAQEEGGNPVEALIGMARKHWTSLVQMSRDPKSFSMNTWLEKTTDLRNYTILLEGLLVDEGVKDE